MLASTAIQKELAEEDLPEPVRELAIAMAAMAVSVAAATGETPRRFLVQQMVRGGEELLLGIRRDPLGMVMLLGFGGITAELFGDSTIRLLPEHGGLSLEQAHEMMRELKGWPLLNGFRGRPLADQSALARAMVAFSAMAAQLGDRLIEAEINPLFVLPLGQGVLAADACAGGSSRGNRPRCLSSRTVKSYRVRIEEPAAHPSPLAARRRRRCSRSSFDGTRSTSSRPGTRPNDAESRERSRTASR